MSLVNSKSHVMNEIESLLRRTLHANWAFSTLSGLLLIFFNDDFQQLFDFNYPFNSVGVQLLVFAGIVAFAAFKKKVIKGFIYTIVVMDVIWVLYCVGVVLSPTGISGMGNTLIALSALVVAGFASFQFIGMRKISTAPEEAI